jgi:lipopolysaccharide transport system ATP-binding protein
MPAIHAHNLGKRYYRRHPDRPRTLQETFLQGLRRPPPGDYFWALRHIDLDLEPGAGLGLIGQNGAGKSTLLRLVGGVGAPDEGKISVRGRVGALLDLGTGFHPELTGRENVYTCGVIAGLTQRQVRQRFDAIVAFAELEDFIDSPLRTYSSGMQMRLGFAVAVHTEPEVLLIDEVLTVGDMAFQHKCLERILGFKRMGCTILFASHDMELLGGLCDQVIWLESGRAVSLGEANEVIDQYTLKTTEQWAV